MVPVIGALPVRAQGDARQWVHQAVDAMGGEDVVRGVTSLRLIGVGHEFALDQSERPEGPWLTVYQQIAELRDYASGSLRRTMTQRSLWSPQWSGGTIVVSGGVGALIRGEGPQRPYLPARTQQMLTTMSLSPERILLAALEAPDLRAGADEVLQGVDHHVVAFTLDTRPVTLFLNAYSHLPTAVEMVQANDMDVWGDVATRIYYSLWTLERGGFRFPYQWDTTHDGTPASSLTLTEIDVNAAAPADSFRVDSTVVPMYRQLGQMTAYRDMAPGWQGETTLEVADDVVIVRGAYNSTIVRQDDGLVVIEAPLSSAYVAKVLDVAAQLFPGVPVKAAVNTSDAWPHIGGVRGYVARGVPVYTLDLNVPLLQRLAGAAFTQHPDALADAPEQPLLHGVDGKTVIGEGDRRVELYPVHGEGGERMLMVYVPAHRLLYGADLVQPMPDGTFFFPQYLTELVAAVDREGLDVQTVFALHATPVPWTDVLKAIDAATAPADR